MGSLPTEKVTYSVEVTVTRTTEYRDSYTREMKSSEDVEVGRVFGQSNSLDQAIGKGRMLLATLLDSESGVSDE